MNSTEDNRERTPNTNEEEPSNKRKRSEVEVEEENQETLLKKLLMTFHHTVSERLDSIENRLECVTNSCKALEEKLEVLDAAWKESSSTQHFISTAGSPGSVSSEESEHCAVSLGSSVTFITLNSEGELEIYHEFFVFTTYNGVMDIINHFSAFSFTVYCMISLSLCALCCGICIPAFTALNL
ncbi:protein BANP-like [Limulus polyphemus]|uniref:Protein BANP-like n=1 Tax=Limulus polyphemus TaxID=6850 RepID=A0ABM1SJ67_LIMPO|nr:protein BANP-like [Limulus polyphemus]